ncbi:dipeptidase [Massilia sp. CF038]|uniref:dipeptidase n=1 Tax=Massilia sp. CF038 TaxID=1881045 RepID=UPI00091BF5E8|nr:dipeptidase [Massilia sp. CF038]SHH18771.1 dipeptidase D [Massilia sp. CF038]
MRLPALVASLFFASTAAMAGAPSPQASAAARHAVTTYQDAVVDSLAAMVSFNTVADPALPLERNPQHIAFKLYLKETAARLGLDFKDHGAVVVIGFGDSSERIGLITHGDVQPVDPSKWKKSPFELDRTSEPGRLLGRGSEDDKGSIATAMFAMKAIRDQNLPLKKRLELYVYMAEESDWDPLTVFLKTHVPPQINLTFDAEYPAVVAEKGWGAVRVNFPPAKGAAGSGPFVAAFAGGFFGSQIPEDASAVIENATPALAAAVRARAARQNGMHYEFKLTGKRLAISARGVSAHSSKPEDGINAISMLADALKVRSWPDRGPGALVNFLNDLVGTGWYGERFGKIAYRDAFMGPMTFAPTVIKASPAGDELNINLRRPRGKQGAVLEQEIRAAITAWQGRHGHDGKVAIELSEPWVQDDAPQLPTLLSVYAHYTGQTDPKPIAIGGGTNSRLFPHAVAFGPAMPGAVYTGHSEHEFITTQQLLLNLEMVTAVMVELAK